MTWPHFIDFLTALFWSAAILLFAGCLSAEFADRRAKPKGRPVDPAPHVAPPVPAAGGRVPSPRGPRIPTSPTHGEHRG